MQVWEQHLSVLMIVVVTELFFRSNFIYGSSHQFEKKFNKNSENLQPICSPKITKFVLDKFNANLFYTIYGGINST